MKNIIVNMVWERANLHIEFKNNVKKAILFNKDKEYELKTKNNIITIPFYNIKDGSILDEGIYNIKIDNELLKINKEQYKELDNLSRILKYKDVYSYTVELSSDEERILTIETAFWLKNRKPHKNNMIKEGIGFKNKIKKFLLTIKYLLMNLVYKIGRLFKNKRNVLFLSENDNELSVNLKPLKETLEKEKYYKINTFTINTFKHNVSILTRFKEVFEIAKSDYVVIDNYTPILTYLKLSDNVKLIQLWHAAIGFKSVGYARFGKTGSPHPYISGHRRYDYAIVDSEKLIEVYEEVFGISKEKILPLGLPRLDNFLNKKNIDETKKELFDEYPNLKDKKIILFAPTYRGKGQKDAFYDMDKITQKELYDYAKNNNAIVLFKFHPFINNKLEIKKEYNDLLIDISEYKSINDLLYLTDILITDYSSCAYEASLLDIPIIFYRYDKEEYEYVRGIHTADAFTSKTIEVVEENMLINSIKELMNIKRKNIKYEERNSCEKIIENIFRR